MLAADAPGSGWTAAAVASDPLTVMFDLAFASERGGQAGDGRVVVDEERREFSAERVLARADEQRGLRRSETVFGEVARFIEPLDRQRHELREGRLDADAQRRFD